MLTHEIIFNEENEFLLLWVRAILIERGIDLPMKINVISPTRNDTVIVE